MIISPVLYVGNVVLHVSVKAVLCRQLCMQKRSVSWVSWPQNLDGTTTVVEFYVVNDFSQVYHNKSIK